MQHPGNQDNGVGSSPAATGATGTATTNKSHVNGGRFDFDDGGTFCGGWEEGKAHGHGVCTGPKGQGAYSGSWHYGFEVSGVYTWPSGSTFEGQWQNGKRHGLGVETRGRWIYRGEWTQGFKGRYGVRQSNTSSAKYEGTWANGLQDGYGSETYADEGTYQGQWLRGMRHGYGVRTSAPFGKASKFRASKAIRASLSSLNSKEGPGSDVDKRERRVDDTRGGFVLQKNSTEPSGRRKSLGSSNIKKGLLMGWKLKKQRSTGDLEKRGVTSGSLRSTASTASWVSSDSAQSAMTNASIPSDSNASFVVEDDQMDPSVKETYMGEWKNDKRTGFGVSERSDGLKYEGEWYNNKKYGYGVTTFSNGEKEEGKYKNNVLITNPKKKHLFLMRSAKFRERIDAAVGAAQRASKIALQKADIAISRTATARGKAEQADILAANAREDSDYALTIAKQYAPDFSQPGLEKLRARERYREKFAPDSSLHNPKDFSVPNQNPNPLSSPLLNQIPNEIPNQAPSQMSNQFSNQLHAQKTNPMHNQIPNQTPNKLINQTSPNLVNNPTHNQTFYGNHQPPDLPKVNYSNTYQQTSSNLPNAVPPQKKMLPSLNNPSNFPGGYLATQINQQMDNHNPAQTKSIANEEPNNESNRLMRNSLPTTDPNQVNSLRRASRRVSADRPYLGSVQQQPSIDHFDHYKRPPSRDSSVDRYSRATERLSGSRLPSTERGVPSLETLDRSIRAPSVVRGTTPVPTQVAAKNGSVLTGNPVKNNPQSLQTPPFEDILLKKRNLGQDIIPSFNQPKRTESLYVAGGVIAGGGVGGSIAVGGGGGIPGYNMKNLIPQTTLTRKKSMPDFQELPRATGAMSREEVSALGSARREEIRRQADRQERLRANPLLYLVSPEIKDWFARQQLVIMVLFVNISLAIMFYKILT